VRLELDFSHDIKTGLVVLNSWLERGLNLKNIHLSLVSELSLTDSWSQMRVLPCIRKITKLSVTPDSCNFFYFIMRNYNSFRGLRYLKYNVKTELGASLIKNLGENYFYNRT